MASTRAAGALQAAHTRSNRGGLPRLASTVFLVERGRPRNWGDERIARAAAHPGRSPTSLGQPITAAGALALPACRGWAPRKRARVEHRTWLPTANPAGS